jgi:hypothetical protein
LVEAPSERPNGAPPAEHGAAPDCLQPTLRCGFRQQVSLGVGQQVTGRPVTASAVPWRPVELKAIIFSTEKEAWRVSSDFTNQWQSKLRPVMTWVLICSGIIYLIVSGLYMWWGYRQVELINATPMTEILNELPCSPEKSVPAAADVLDCQQLRATLALETRLVQQRFDEMRVVMMIRMSMKYLGFMVGMILCLVGAVFILGRLDHAPR